jgi:multicomponent Na+:H+ antiporter subunit F
MINEILIISIVISLIRFIKGPTLLDRIFITSIINSIVISIIFIQALSEKNVLMTDVSLVYALLSMFGIYTLTRYLVKK